MRFCKLKISELILKSKKMAPRIGVKGKKMAPRNGAKGKKMAPKGAKKMTQLLSCGCVIR